MVILVTGSAGHLGEGLMRMLRAEHGHDAVRGLDVQPSPYTDIVGSIVDPNVCRTAIQENNVSAVLHTASLHKPHVATHSKQDFIDTNITGTLNLLQAAVDAGTVTAFVFTSTTSAFGEALVSSDGTTTTWIDEGVTPIPKNIYGVTKTAAEDLCALFGKLHRLPVVVLKVSRFFPEDDDKEQVRQFCTTENAKVNELLHRRADLYDMCTAHVAAMHKAPTLIGGGGGFDNKFIITSTTPFAPTDRELLSKDAPTAVAQKFGNLFTSVYRAHNWKMFPTLDRVYDNAKARRVLGWTPVYTFGHALECLQQGQPIRSELARQVGKKYYHPGNNNSTSAATTAKASKSDT